MLRRGEYTPWIRLNFGTAIHTGVAGIVRFLLTSTSPDVSLYMSPINIDPEKPALPVSQPAYYAAYLANLIGPFATTGMAEDTWALNEHVIDSDAFLKQAWDIFEERESMFLSALENTRRGVVACVFDTSDRIQHMFYRQFQDGTGEHAGGHHPGGPQRAVATVRAQLQQAARLGPPNRSVQDLPLLVPDVDQEAAAIGEVVDHADRVVEVSVPSLGLHVARERQLPAVPHLPLRGQATHAEQHANQRPAQERKPLPAELGCSRHHSWASLSPSRQGAR